MIEIFFEKTAVDSYREMSEAAYALLKSKLSEYLSVASDEIIVRKDEKGKPFVVGFDNCFVSISHSHGVVMCAYSDSEIGVDIEFVKNRRKSVEKRVFTDGEINLIERSANENEAFFSLWTLKESYLKAIGTGFADNALNVEFFSLSSPIESNQNGFSFTVGSFDDFVYSVCQKNSC